MSMTWKRENSFSIYFVFISENRILDFFFYFYGLGNQTSCVASIMATKKQNFTQQPRCLKISKVREIQDCGDFVVFRAFLIYIYVQFSSAEIIVNHTLYSCAHPKERRKEKQYWIEWCNFVSCIGVWKNILEIE